MPGAPNQPHADSPRPRRRATGDGDSRSYTVTPLFVQLRRFTSNHVADHLRDEDHEMLRWLSGRASTPENVRDWIATSETGWHANGPRFLFTIEYAF